MMRRLGVLVAATALVVLGAAPALADDFTFDLTVDPTATLNQFNAEITVTGTYTCTGNYDPEFSGLGGEVFQSYKGGKVVVGGGWGLESLLDCDGTDKEWTAVIGASSNGEQAVFKRGRVIVNFGGGISDGGDEETGHHASDGFLGTVRITK